MAAEQLGPVRTCCRPRFLSLVGKLSSQYDQKNPQKQQRNVQKRLLGWQRCWLRGAARPLDWMTAWGVALGAHPGQRASSSATRGGQQPP